MSEFSLLPTAIVSPLISSEIEPTTSSKISAIDPDNTENKLNQFVQSKDVSNTNETTKSLADSLSISSVTNKQNSFKALSSLSSSLHYSSITNCTVELTNCKELDDLKTTQGSKKSLLSSVKKKISKKQHSASVLHNRSAIKKVFTFVPKIGKKKTVKVATLKSLKLAALSSTNKFKERTSKSKVLKKNNLDTYKCRRKRFTSQKHKTCTSNMFPGSTRNLSMYTPKLADIMQRFFSSTVVCSFCHLPAHFLPGLGDLFGPYRISFDELLERYDAIKNKYTKQWPVNQVSSTSVSKQEVRVDEVNKTCYITTSNFGDNDETKNDYSLQSTSGSEKNVHSMMPKLRMFQAIDCVLTESGRKPALKYSSYSKSLRIPGFSGKITTAEKNILPHANRNRNLLHDLNTIVFIEPTKTYPHYCSETTNNKESLDDTTSVDVVHRFNVSPVWVHAPCAIWTPGIYCVENEVMGVAAAVRDASRITCGYCHQTGASIPCKLKKNVSYHYQCCLAQGLVMDNNIFMACKP